MSEEKIKIVSAEFGSKVSDIGKDACAEMLPGNRFRYYVDVTYFGENKQEIKSIVRALTKPKLKQRIEVTKEHIARGMLTYSRDFAGNWYQTISFYIGPASAAAS